MVTVLKIKEICDKILRSDENIRMVAISYRIDFFFKVRPKAEIFQTKEQIEQSLADASLRWVSRRSILSIGEPIYAMAKYQKVSRISVPFGRYGTVLCTINRDSDVDSVASKIIKVLKRYEE